MGYSSTMNNCEFMSDLTLDDIKRKFDEFKHKVGNGKFLDYDFEYNGDNWYEVVPHYGDYTMKHYNDKLLAIFLSSIIKPHTSAELQFVGEDGEHWGWYIESFKLKKMYVEWKRSERYEDFDLNLLNN